MAHVLDRRFSSGSGYAVRHAAACVSLQDALAQYEEAVKRGEAASDPLLDTFREHRDAARKKLARR